MLGEPHAFMKCLNQTPPEPWVKSATASGPCRFDTSSSLRAVSFSAASQETSSKTSSPRFARRTSGFFRRSGS